MGSRVVAGLKPWSSLFWTGIMPSTRWGNGWKSGGWWRCYSRDSRGPRSMITAWGTSWMRCLQPISTRCLARSPSKPWRSMPLPYHGCIRTRRPLPLLVEKPGRTKDEAPRRWHGHSVLRRVEVEYSEGRVAQEELRFVVVHSSQLAQQQSHTYAVAQEKEGAAVADHVKHVQAQWFACEADAVAAIAAYEGRGPGRRGRRPHAWRYHTVRYGL